MRSVFRLVSVCAIAVVFATVAFADPMNLALNTSCPTGNPSPLGSSSGWGGGSYKCDLVDGLHSYTTWARGLAFTGGSGPYIEPAGVRQATIDFGANKTFSEVIIWHHGTDHTPAAPWLDYWNGSSWVPIPFLRTYGTMHEEGSGSGYSDSDIYDFSPVTGSMVRYSLDNRLLNINGTQITHGWLYEFEVFNAVPEPSSILLLIPVGAAVAFRLRKKYTLAPR